MTRIYPITLDPILTEAFKTTRTVAARQPRSRLLYPTSHDETVADALSSDAYYTEDEKRHDDYTCTGCYRCEF